MEFPNMTTASILALGQNMSTTTQTVEPVPIYLTGSVSQAEYQRYSLILVWVLVFCQPICLACLLLSALVFLRNEMRNPTTHYLVALNLSEALYVALLCVNQFCKLNYYECHTTESYHQFVFYATNYIGMTCRRCVFIFNCLVSVQRFIVIAFPMSARQSNILQNSVPICIATFLFSLACHMYIPLGYKVVSRGGAYFFVPTDIGRENIETFQSFSSLVVYSLVYTPLLVGALANIGIAISLKRHSSHMNKVKSTREGQGHKELQTNIVVLVSTGLFFLFSLPMNTNLILGNALENYGSMEKEHYLYLLILSISMFSNQVVSDLIVFISYLSLSSAFRRNSAQLVAMVLRLRLKKK